MRHSSSLAMSDAMPSALNNGDDASLRKEIARLRRENRALSIALAEMERVAERDMLTPLFNRRYFLSALHQRIARADQQSERSVLIFADVDGLKAINDRYGHAAGDYALVEIAGRLSTMMRDGDILARIGGDEFGIVIDNVGASEARSKMRRLAEAIGGEPCEYDGHRIMLSAAFGMTSIAQGASAEELLGRADAEMYRAKRTN
jgi:diguanylate cyclase (GGDEF)-like protein